MRGNPLLGIQYFGRGFSLLSNKGLKRFVAFPILINALLMTALIYFGGGWLVDQIKWVVDWFPSWLSWLTWIITPVAALTLISVTLYFFSAVLNLVASPLNGLLSEAVETKITGEKMPDEPMSQLASRTFQRELQKLGYFIPRYLGLLVISFIPVVNFVSPVLWFVFGAWVLTLQFLDYSLDNNGHSFADLHKALKLQPLTTLGFGFVVAVSFMVPIVNLFVMPAAVCGATLYWCEQIKAEFKPA
ncbi:MAG: sulfate transporter CysZ [Oleispira antarctica]|uniref:Putative sulfate transport protein CysZ n=1 Tax=Oleispira antarctica RB-8 TaxID=698738 RepID=R4YVE4_OLEAN|nr:sulfate transporter CysZ [Oleispira antarctica]MBQ0794165.1 sulfate transporter CysZ [Oleispira antarctica]CCK78054.1 Putative sulfate transport protein CysZ [Oleispira antarctica RB-8]